ncbi:hypothetical protein GCT13_22125 [Paraburkholderia sp. CNPSo 3157]|uniref:Peptide-binding protein n=1 Tax=Paraburkholderia franconis TaxID=2654983 RepID=A0A7X1THG0_9BURK|nr:hypothetical protein [Paraburkholderia franconis]MPW19527.1 hypothetical protein [Paraburkholderia franconis]
MVHVGLSRIKWWGTSALVIALTSLAYAKPPFASHEGHGFFGGGAAYRVSSFGGPVHGNQVPRANVSPDVAHGSRYARNDAQHVRVNATSRAGTSDAYAGHIGGSASRDTMQRMTLPYDVYRNRPSAQYVGTQYAGAITPISTDSRPAPRPPANAQSAHVGSIRDDVARYNEERGVSRQIPRPPADSRIPAPSPYRN